MLKLVTVLLIHIYFVHYIYILFITYLEATSVHISTERLLFLNLLRAARRLFCDICPCSGTAARPRLRSNSAVRSAPAHVATNTMNELPDISFRMWTRYTSCGMIFIVYITIKNLKQNLIQPHFIGQSICVGCYQ